MKLTGCILMFLLFGATANAQTNKPTTRLRFATDAKSSLRNIVAEARRLDRVSYLVGFANHPGEFYEISEACLWFGKRDDFESMLKDQNLIVRVLGLVCLAKTLSREDFSEVASGLFMDFAVIRYTNGCVEARGTVGSIARNIANGSFVLTKVRLSVDVEGD